jgi:hypothetical protein
LAGAVLLATWAKAKEVETATRRGTDFRNLGIEETEADAS